KKLQQIVENVDSIRVSLRQAAAGPNTIIGANDVKEEEDPILGGAEILVADDELNIRTTIHDILRKYHANVTVASNGAEAIKILDRGEFDLVPSDIKMPDKTGYDVFASARRKAEHLPVILMTGFCHDPNPSIIPPSQEG